MSKAAHRWVHVSQTSAEMCLFSENLHVVTSRSWYNFVETCRIGWTNGKLCSKLTNLNAVWIDIVDIGLLTINSCRVSSVNFVDIIVFAIVCIVVAVSICERLWVVLLVTLLWMMYWCMHWCVEFEKNKNAFLMHKRLFYSRTIIVSWICSEKGHEHYISRYWLQIINSSLIMASIDTLQERREVFTERFFKTSVILDTSYLYSLLPEKRDPDSLRQSKAFQPLITMTVRFRKSFVHHCLKHYQ